MRVFQRILYRSERPHTTFSKMNTHGEIIKLKRAILNQPRTGDGYYTAVDITVTVRKFPRFLERSRRVHAIG